jgi:hypothetical protein
MPEVTLDFSKPFYIIRILDKDSNNLKFEWSPNIFMTTERPENESTIAPQTYVEDIEVKSNFMPPINIGEVKINHSVGFTPNIVIKDIIKIFYGYYTLSDQQTPVYSLIYSGKIDYIKAGLNFTKLKASSTIKKLTITRRELAISRVMTLTDLIKKLAIDDGGLEEATDGISDTEISKQKGYAISKNLSVYDHIKKLADYAGFDVYMDPFDKFNAREWSPQPISGGTGAIPWVSERDSSESDAADQLMHQIYFGVNIVDMELDIKGKKLSDVDIVALADSEGSEIFSTEPPESKPTSSSSSGGGSDCGESTSNTATEETEETVPTKIVMPRVSKEDAEKIAEALLTHNNSNLSGSLTIIGSPQIRLADGVKILGHIYGKSPFDRIGIPTSDYDASYSTGGEGEETEGSGSSSSSGSSEETIFKVTGLRHIFNDKMGFITRLSIIEATPAEIPEEEETEEVEEEEGEAESRVEEADFSVLAQTEIEGEPEEELYTDQIGDFEGIFILGQEEGQPLLSHKFTLVYPEGTKERYISDDTGEFKFEDMKIPTEGNEYQLVADDLPQKKRKQPKFKFIEALK